MSIQDRKIFINTRLQAKSISVDETRIFDNLSPAEQKAYTQAIARRTELELKHTAVTVPKHARVEFTDQEVNGAHVHGLRIRQDGHGHINIDRGREAVTRAAADYAINQGAQHQSSPIKDMFNDLRRSAGLMSQKEKEAAERIYGGKTIAGQSAPSGLLTESNLKADYEAGRLDRARNNAQRQLINKQSNDVKITEGSQAGEHDIREQVAYETTAREHLPGFVSTLFSIGSGIFGGTTREVITCDPENLGLSERSSYRGHVAEIHTQSAHEAVGGSNMDLDSFRGTYNRTEGDGIVYERNGKVVGGR